MEADGMQSSVGAAVAYSTPKAAQVAEDEGDPIIREAQCERLSGLSCSLHGSKFLPLSPTLTGGAFLCAK